MSIDDLIALLEEERADYEKSNKAEIVRNWGTGIKLAIRVIENNRDALAGTRGVLQFKWFSSGNMGFWVWVDENGKGITGKYHGDWLIAYQTKENVLDHVGKLNLTAEFEPAEPEESDETHVVQ